MPELTRVPVWIRLRLTIKALWVILLGLLTKAARWRPWRKPPPPKPPTTAERFRQEVGEAVKPSQVMQFAKKSCSTCSGQGTSTRVMPDGGRQLVLCGCGLHKFVRIHKEELIRVQHQLFWKPKVPGQAPTRGDATRLAAMVDDGTLGTVIHSLKID